MSRRKSQVIYVPSRAEWKRVFATVDKRTPTGARDLAMYYLMYYCGMRVGEVLYLRRSNIDVVRGRITTPREGKTGERPLVFPDSLAFQAAIERWLKVRAKWDADWQSEWFFISRTGEQVADANVRATLAKRGQKAGIEMRLHPHLMRHSFATELLQDGAEIPEIQQLLGHASINTTIIYLNCVTGRAHDILRARVVD